MSFRLSCKAEDDIIQLYLSGVRDFGAAQAEDYYAGLEPVLTFLANYPSAARERREINPSVRIHRYRSHLIVYVIEDPGILVLRIRHGREDWAMSPGGE